MTLTKLYDPPRYICPECGDLDLDNVGLSNHTLCCIGCGQQLESENEPHEPELLEDWPLTYR